MDHVVRSRQLLEARVRHLEVRLREHGGRILLSPLIRSVYTVRSTPRALWRQYYQYGFWKIRVLQKHPRQMSLRQFVPPAFVLSLFVSLVFFIFHPSDFIFALPAFIYLSANLFASILTAIKNRSSYSSLLATLCSLPFVFAILHISYGLGFLVGLVKFARRWGDKRGKTPTLAGRDA